MMVNDIIQRKIINFSIILLLSTFVTLFSSCEQRQSEKPTTQQQSTTNMIKHFPVFSGKSAYDYLLKQTNFGPRNPNSTGHQQCLQFLENELKKSADKVTLQNFTHQGYNETLRLTNIFAQFKPELQQRILLLAHWDTRPRAEEDADPKKRNQPIIGANDGASGVAVLLELARLFKNNPLPIGVDILLTDGEDYGFSSQDGSTDLYFLGAKYFAKTKSAAYTPEYGILLDMIGDKDLQLPLEQNSIRFAPQLMDVIWTTAEEVAVTNFIRVPGESISDDHLALNDVGIPTIDIIDFQYPHWHTHQDTPDKCSSESLEAVGKVLSTVIYTKLKK
jgi:glutaminyl-peptide cyclotransferase